MSGIMRSIRIAGLVKGGEIYIHKKGCSHGFQLQKSAFFYSLWLINSKGKKRNFPCLSSWLAGWLQAVSTFIHIASTSCPCHMIDQEIKSGSIAGGVMCFQEDNWKPGLVNQVPWTRDNNIQFQLLQHSSTNRAQCVCVSKVHVFFSISSFSFQ